MGIIENIAEEINKNADSELKKCFYCGKPYKWFIRDLKGIGKQLKVQVPDCQCQRNKEKQLAKARYMQQKAEKLAKLFDNSMMTPYFKEKKFNCLAQTIELQKCREYAKNFNDFSGGISMIGATGTGKTTLLACICNELMEKDYSVLFTTLSALLDKFTSHAYENAGNIETLLNWLIAFDFVVLDDIGRETYTEKRKEIAFRIIDTLLNHKIAVGYTANPEMIVKLKKIPEWNATLDRLKDICKLNFRFEGESLRGRQLNYNAIKQESL